MEKEFWNERYGQEEFVYGIHPNEYLKEKLQDLPKGKILFAAEGEGRNSVYAAKLGWNSYAFDQSEAGKTKAILLAEKNEVEIDYIICGADEIDYPENSFDALALIYAHFPGEFRREFHQKLAKFLKPGGVLILEGFSKNQEKIQRENPKAGGPRLPEMLWDLEELKKDFEGFECMESVETEIELDEGNYHKGLGAVVRIFAKK